MPVQVEPRPPLTVRQLIEDLSPGQLWSLLTALAALTVGAFTLGQQYAASKVIQAVPCRQIANWPVGTWLTWGHISHAGGPADRPFPQIAERVTLHDAGSGSLITDEKGNNQFFFTVTPPLPKEVVPVGFEIKGKDSTGYTSESHVTLTEDGCVLRGTFTDSYGDSGTINYLYERQEYLVRR